MTSSPQRSAAAPLKSARAQPARASCSRSPQRSAAAPLKFVHASAARGRREPFSAAISCGSIEVLRDTQRGEASALVLRSDQLRLHCGARSAWRKRPRHSEFSAAISCGSIEVQSAQARRCSYRGSPQRSAAAPLKRFGRLRSLGNTIPVLRQRSAAAPLKLKFGRHASSLCALDQTDVISHLPV
jgi:hypothetical protein